jgi:hypothetical protein
MAARREVTGRRPADAADPADLPVEKAAYTVPEFCVAHRMSLSAYYALKAKGLGPDETDVGRNVVTYENAAKWRRKRTKISEA